MRQREKENLSKLESQEKNADLSHKESSNGTLNGHSRLSKKRKAKIDKVKNDKSMTEEEKDD